MRFNNLPTLEWLNFITINRRIKGEGLPNKEPRHDYNWVSGPIANDKIANVIDEYLLGEISDNDAIKKAKALSFTHQLSLHSELTVDLIEKKEKCFKEYKNSRWSNNWVQIIKAT